MIKVINRTPLAPPPPPQFDIEGLSGEELAYLTALAGACLTRSHDVASSYELFDKMHNACRTEPSVIARYNELRRRVELAPARERHPSV